MPVTSSRLFAKAQKIIVPDDKITPVETPYPFGFFPGGHGTFDKSNDISGKKIMVLGQDYDTVAAFVTEEDLNNNTWRGMKKLLQDLEIDPQECFFTNAYMGLRKEGKNTGPNPGGKAFKESCRVFLKEQIRDVKPKVILALGLEPLKCMAATFPDELSKWDSAKTVTALLNDTKSMHQFLSFEGRDILVALVIHPCMNASNRTRIFGKENGDQEVKQLKPLLERALK